MGFAGTLQVNAINASFWKMTDEKTGEIRMGAKLGTLGTYDVSDRSIGLSYTSIDAVPAVFEKFQSIPPDKLPILLDCQISLKNIKNASGKMVSAPVVESISFRKSA